MNTYMIAFMTVPIILLVELILSSTWSSLYFSKGLVLFRNEVKTPTTTNPDDLVNTLNESFKKTLFSPSIKFKRISDNLIGFKEPIFEFSLISYTPVMHGAITLDKDKINVLSKLNLYPLSFIFLWYYSLLPTFHHEIDLMFLIVLSIDSDEHLDIIKYLFEKHHFDIHVQDDMLIRNAFRFKQNETIKCLVEADNELRLIKFLSAGTLRRSAPQVFKYTIVNKILKNTVLSNDVIGHISTFL